MIAMTTTQWDAIENKSSVLFYGGGAIIAVWLSSSVVKAVDSVPVVYAQLILLFPHLLVAAAKCCPSHGVTCLSNYSSFM